jgi:hypothetical protein
MGIREKSYTSVMRSTFDNKFFLSIIPNLSVIGNRRTMIKEIPLLKEILKALILKLSSFGITKLDLSQLGSGFYDFS